MSATKVAWSMVSEWGMSDELGAVLYDERNESGQYLGMSGYRAKNYSEDTAEKIDSAVKALIETAHKQAVETLYLSLPTTSPDLNPSCNSF